MDFRAAIKQEPELDEGFSATSTDLRTMNKMKNELNEELLVTSDNFGERIKTIKAEVNDDDVNEYTNDAPVPMQLISYVSEPNSNDIDGTYDEYEIVIKAEPELEILGDELQFPDELNSSQKYSCSQCAFVTNRKYYLDIHNEMMHSRQENTDPVEVACPQCDYKANNKSTVKRHMIVAHLSDKIQYSCYICDFKTRNLLSLHSHRSCHRNVKSYSCPHCTTFKCTQLAAMRDHERIHLVQMSSHTMLFCAHCDYRTYFKYSLKMHSKLHLTEKPQDQPIHSCSLCDFQTKRLRVLKVHHRRIHLGEEPFRCPECKQSYSTNGSLMRHLKTHSKEEHSIKCMECDYKTLQYSQLKFHMRTHSKPPQMHTCDHCGYSTPRKGVLQTHMKIHRISHTCSQCNFNTHAKSVFMKHKCHAGMQSDEVDEGLLATSIESGFIRNKIKKEVNGESVVNNNNILHTL